MGGMVAAIEQGYVQREIQAAAYRYQLEIEDKKRIIVGQNEFVSEAPPVPVMKIDPRVEREQVERTRALRAAHEGPVKAAALAAIDAAARGDGQPAPAHARRGQGGRDRGRDQRRAPRASGASTGRR